MEKRYQVFVSSTFADLQDERSRVLQTLMEMDCIPAGMELFPAADEEQWAFIKKIVDDCDYYLLIIGGRYGSISSDGVSYTEKEYDYAVSKGMKVVALLHAKPLEIPVGKSEMDSQSRVKLESFREKVKQGRLVRFWERADDLPGLVSVSLSKTIKTYPAEGWVRANAVGNEDLLAQLNQLRLENEKLRVDLANSRPAPIVVPEDLAGLDESFKIRMSTIANGATQRFFREFTWRTIFHYVSPYLLKRLDENSVKLKLAHAFGLSLDYRNVVRIEDQDFQTIALQLKALGLVKIENLSVTDGSRHLFWSLTPAGEQLMVNLRLVRAKGSGDSEE